MATLTFFPPDGQESKFELVGELSVGREDGNDVVLPEGGLSRKHARFFEKGGQILVEDLGSSNGTFVDGERIEAPTPISDAQEILVANIKVVLTAKAARGAAPRRQDPATQKKNGSRGATGLINAKPAGRSNPPGPARNGTGSNGALAKRGATGGANGAVARKSGPGAAVAKAAEGEEGPTARASLRGQTGPWSNKRFPIGKVATVIGRVDGNDIVIEDDSISRKHAEIRRSGGGYMLKDLQSANGTFVNGERITEAPLVPGDVIKFGVVEFTYSGPSLSALRGATEEAKAKKKKTLQMAGLGGGLLLIVGLAAAKLTEPPPAVSHDATTLRGKSVDDGPDTAALLSMCRAFSDPDGNQLDWARAIDACQKVLTADPINVDARKLKKLSEKEVAQKKIFDGAHHLFDLGDETEAMGEYLKIDSDSYYYRQARSEFRKAAPVAMKHSGETCYSEFKAGFYEKAWPDCKRMMDVGDYLGFHTVNEQMQQKTFQDLAARFKKDPWTKRDDFGRFLGGDTVSDYTKLRHDAIYKQYSDPPLAKAVNDFAIDPVSGMQGVQRYIGAGGKDIATAKELYRHMENAQGSHQSGYEAMLQFDLKKASVEFHTQLDEDAKVMPQTPQAFESDLSRQTRKDISEAFAKRGKELFTEGRLPDSFGMCEGGGDFQLGNPSVLECYSALEDKAAAMADQGCDQAKTAAAITRKDSPVHKKAAKYVTDNCQ